MTKTYKNKLLYLILSFIAYFTIMVIMALVSTVMVSPIWKLIFFRYKLSKENENSDLVEITDL
jgi:hypothetical protein